MSFILDWVRNIVATQLMLNSCNEGKKIITMVIKHHILWKFGNKESRHYIFPQWLSFLFQIRKLKFENSTVSETRIGPEILSRTKASQAGGWWWVGVRIIWWWEWQWGFNIDMLPSFSFDLGLAQEALKEDEWFSWILESIIITVEAKLRNITV